jgi:pentatricopeptide repeat protein
MDSDGVPPGLPELEGVLRAFRESGSLDAVEEAFDEMLLRGLVPTITIPSSAVS